MQDKFKEIYYLARSRYNADFKISSLAVAALAAFLWDFEENGEDSDLYKLLVEKDVNK